jgi:hypothetical protein
MSNGTPLLEITNAGLAAASVATPTGPYIHITQFEIGSAYGYTPLNTDTGINGNLLYTGTPTSYEYIGNNTLNIICEIPVDAGPWQFGEVALFLPGGVMFAKGVFSEPQTKYSSLGTNVVSSYTFNCLLKLQQSVAVFQIDTINGPPAVVDIYQWSDVYPPGISANPDVPLYVVRELSPANDATLLENASDSFWTVGTTYNQVNNQAVVQASSTTWVEFSQSIATSVITSSANRQWLLETPDGFFRSVNNVAVSGSNYRFNLNCSNDGTYNNTPLLNAPSNGSLCRLYSSTQIGFNIYYSQILNPPTIPQPPLATVGTPGLAYGDQGLYMPTPGVIQAFGMLQSPSDNTGRLLTSADDLDNVGLASGMYYMFGTTTGRPANIPADYDFIIWNHNIGANSSSNGSDVTQLAFPMNTGGGDSNGINGLPVYWRQGHNTTGGGSANAWTTWEPFMISNKQGNSSGITVTPDFSHQNLAVGSTITPQAGQSGMVVALFSTDGNPGQVQQLIVNGNVVGTATKSGSAGYGRRPELTASFSAGQSIQATSGSGGTVSFFLYYYNS